MLGGYEETSLDEELLEKAKDDIAILRKAINDALDIRDESGIRLRDYLFQTGGFMSELRTYLVKALNDTDSKDFAENTQPQPTITEE